MCDIVKKLPEIDLIKDGELRKKVIETWEDAIKIGGWNCDELDKIPFTLLIPDTDISIIDHTRAVTKTALAMAKEIKNSYGDKIDINFDYLVAGAILHDVGKLLEYGKNDGKVGKSYQGKYLRHPVSGTALAFNHELPVEILNMIAAHSKEGDFVKRRPETIIIYHADFANFEPFRE